MSEYQRTRDAAERLLRGGIMPTPTALLRALGLHDARSLNGVKSKARAAALCLHGFEKDPVTWRWRPTQRSPLSSYVVGHRDG